MAKSSRMTMTIACHKCGAETEFTVRSRLSRDFDAELKQLRQREINGAEPSRLNERLAELRRDGYTLQVLGEAVGLTRERVRQRVKTVLPAE